MFAIYNYIGLEENKGGPSGYLYHLNCGFQENGYDIAILSDMSSAKRKKKVEVKRDKIEFIAQGRNILHFYKIGLKIKYESINNWNAYNVIHVMSSEDAYYLKKLYGYKGKIVLTSHKPESLADEKISGLNLRNGTNWKCRILRIFYDYIEKKAYKLSDAFVFPSINSEAIYNNFPGYRKYSKGKTVKYVYTGCVEKKVTLDREFYRKNIGISENDFAISYIGRHNYIKGYDLLADIGEKLIDNHINIICAGAKTTISYPLSPNWKELGFISDVQNLINASDAVVVPNRNTYFDLVVIEILSMGKLVITSKTGGNIDIAKHTNGLILFEEGNKQSLYEAILKVKNMKSEERNKLQRENYAFYCNYCSVKKFAQKYVMEINDILNEFGCDCINNKEVICDE